MPETVFKKLNTLILPQWKTCFLTAFAIGVLAHFYKITNWLPNWDSLVFRYDPQNMIGLGRWFLPVVCSLSSHYDLPFLNGLISIMFHALGAVYICRILHIEKHITAGLIGAMLVSFPTVTSVLMYNYVADGYAIAFFLSVLAAWYMTKSKPHYLLASVLIALSSGIYQAYITVTVMLVLLHLIDEILFGHIAHLTALKKCGFMLVSGILGVALYGIVLKILLGIYSAELLDYQGTNSTASLSTIDLPASLYIIKETFLKRFFDLTGGMNVFAVLNGFILLFTLLYYGKCIVKERICQKPVSLLLILVFSVMLIPGAGALAFINPGVDYHNLMLMGYAVFYLFFLLIYERGTEKNEMRVSCKCWIVLAVAVILIANQVVIANVSYHKAQIAYEKSYGVLIRIADRIEQVPGSEECSRILVIGALDESEAYSVNLPPDITGITDGYIIRADDEIVGQSVFCSALNDYCGKDYRFLSGDEKTTWMQREDIRAMEVWPSKNCVAVIDQTVIIKIGTEGDS